MAEHPPPADDYFLRVDASGESLDGGRLLARLQTPDELTLRFSGWGFGGRLDPRDSAEFLVAQMRQSTLHDAVPEDVRATFERVQKVFLYGVLDYDLFTIAINETHLTLEGALRARFVSWYENSIPLLVNGDPVTLPAQSFDDLYRYLRDKGRGNKILLAADPPEQAPRSYTDLFSWARNRGLLAGQRNVGTFKSMVNRRNYAAHPERHSVHMPPDVGRLIRDAAEIINRLWGRDTPGGRLFPGPIARRPRLVAVSADGNAARTMGFSDLAGEDEDEGWTYSLVLAAEPETLWGHDRESPRRITFAAKAGVQRTQFPADVLHGPCELASMQTFIRGVDEASGDEVEFLDRIFYIRATADGIDLPRIAGDVICTPLADRPGDEWYVVRADYPLDAFCAVRDHRPTLKSASGVQLIQRLSGVQKVKAHARQLVGEDTSTAAR